MDVLTSVDEARCADLHERDAFFWIDLCDPSAGEIEALARLLDLHPLAVEDSRDFGQPPKLDDYGNHVLLVFWSAVVAPEAAEEAARALEVHLYIAGGFVVTVHREPAPMLERLHRELKAGGGSEADAVYRILDVLIDAYLPVVEAIETRVDRIEAEVFERVSRSHAPAIYRLKQDVRELQRRVAPQRDRFDHDARTIMRLEGLERGERVYLDDVRDGLVRVASELDRQQADLNSLTGTYYNASSDRLNATATRLTLIGTVFLVWTLITGFFGQNFEWLVSNVSTKADFLVFGVGSLVAGTLLVSGYIWTRRKDLR